MTSASDCFFYMFFLDSVHIYIIYIYYVYYVRISCLESLTNNQSTSQKPTRAKSEARYLSFLPEGKSSDLSLRLLVMLSKFR